MSLSYLNLRPPEHLVGPHAYQAPGPNDLRSPCPFMNSLANHGYINRDGRNLNLYTLIKAQVEVFNFSIPLASILSLGGLFICGNGLTVTLDQLKLHSWISIEHDASLGRQDIRTGNNWTIDPKLVQAMVDECSSPKGLTFQDIARLRVHREATLPAPMDKLHVGVAIREACLTIAQLGQGGGADQTTRVVKPEWIKSFFLHETFPDDWKRPATQLGFEDTKVMGKKLEAEMANYRATLKTK